MDGGVFPGVEVHDVELYSVGLAETDAEFLVATGFFAAQMEVAVHSLHVVSEFFQCERESHAVCSAREGGEIQSVSVHQLVVDYESVYVSRNAFIFVPLFHVQYESFEVFALGVIDVYRMVGRLVELVQDAHLPAGNCRGREYGVAEIVFCHNL